jgi:uncharacterized protein YndB with AHSA1/START domain
MLKRGCLVIADISGYTAFFTQTEIDHAQEIMDGFVDALLARMQPFFTVAKLEGDAIFAYLPDDGYLQPQTVFESLEVLYYTFRLTQEQMHYNTTCTCQACQLIPTLDLKLVAHHGEFIINKRQELCGPSVILTHRLLKNNIVEQTGVTAYLYLTESALTALNLTDLLPRLRPHPESYDHLGQILGYVYDLYPAWLQWRGQLQMVVTRPEAEIVVEFELPLPPELVWDYLLDPAVKRLYREADRLTVLGSKGPVGVGAVHHCVHGLQVNDELIVDWQPYNHVTFQDQISYPFIPAFEMLNTTCFTRLETGTRVTMLFKRPTAENKGFNQLVQLMWWVYGRGHIKRLFGQRAPATLRRLIAADLASGQINLSKSPLMRHSHAGPDRSAPGSETANILPSSTL